MSVYLCCNDNRRQAILNHPAINGIDYLEVRGALVPQPSPLPPDDQRQRVLQVYCIKPLSGVTLTADNISIKGGERISDVAAINVTVGTGTQSNLLTVLVNKTGDFSTYTLCLIQPLTPQQQAQGIEPQPLAGFDPLLSAIDISFKVECPSDFDCETQSNCSPEPRYEPEIDYLSKDYNSFRQLMLDRMAALVPQWRERNPSDLGVVLVEMLAYVGDYLSYQQDAIATEAYLGTARRRISARRHARLVDYFMHDGCNSRTWVQLQVDKDIVKQHSSDPSLLPKGTQLLTLVPGRPVLIPRTSSAYEQALLTQPEVFETTQDVDALYQAHNQMYFYTWGADGCCLPKGATRATLRGSFPHLQKGDVLIFEEVRGANIGRLEDAERTHRCAVRLLNCTLGQDLLGGQFANPPNNDPVDITEIEWVAGDALPFPLCISSTADAEHGNQLISDISVAHGNIVLVDHGLTITNEVLSPVPSPTLVKVPASTNASSGVTTSSRAARCGGNVATTIGSRCAQRTPVSVLPRFRPLLQQRQLTHAATVSIATADGQTIRLPFDPSAPASAAFQWDMRDVLPAITLTTGNETWYPQRDLLGSDPTTLAFVTEVEGDGRTYLRFGDGQHGLRPAPGTVFNATYRVGNGVRGNIGAESLAHIVTDSSIAQHVISVRNPLSARGGVEPESIEDVRQKAPSAFRTQERAVTPDDYAAVAERHPQVLRAAATFRWTGSWRTVFLAIDLVGAAQVDDHFRQDMLAYMGQFRMAGYDMVVDGPIYVSLEIDMTVCVKPDYFRSNVKAALLQVFSNRLLPNGQRGVFYPDNFTFGQPVYLSSLYAAAQAVAGVSSVQITKFQRQTNPGAQNNMSQPRNNFSNDALMKGKLELGRMEIARLDNDPNFPERGVFRLNMEGGK
jgi:Baseplate J-like protein